MAEAAAATRTEQDRVAGTLTVAHKVVRKVVEETARQVPGVTSRSGALDSLRGAGSPHADVRMTGRSATVQLSVDATWPCALADVAAEVRDTVRAEASRLTGVDVHTVDVEIRAVAPDADARERRVS
ncbi:Asp23/Gls24 family envelope stress response protein [Serinicoccus profundi]|uniref:Asp23/Gls24 family envelope stress response protein n=1 Tax=Serinicoccus profundi TaxID=1078471 RepID=UPI000255E804|nr:Asp23/Gls24 family envelope stress response protein [Serinicoccus profundi]